MSTVPATLVFLRWWRDEDLSEAALLRWIERRRGQVVFRDEEGLGVLFGTSLADGRDAELAVRCAMAVRARSARSTSGDGSRLLGAGIHGGWINLEEDGQPRSEDVARLLAPAKEAALTAGPRQILATSSLHGLLEGHFVLDAEHDGTRLVTEESEPRFVGRSRELAAIRSFFRRAARGGPIALCVEGEPGSGRSRLLEKALFEARLDIDAPFVSAVELDASCADRPFIALQLMLRSMLAIDELDSPTMVRAKLRRSSLGFTSAGARAIEAAFEEDGEWSAEHLRHVLKVFRATISRAAQKREVVLVWDDARHMDEASRSLLSGVLDEESGISLPLAMVFITNLGAPPLLVEQERVDRLELGPLDVDDLTQFAAAYLDTAEVPHDLLRDLGILTGGNALLADAHLTSLRALGDLDPTAYEPVHPDSEPPEAVRRVVWARVHTLPQPLADLLEVASAAGRRFTCEVLARMAQLDPERVALHLAEAASRRLLVERGGTYSFTRAWTREVLFRRLAPDRRAALLVHASSLSEQPSAPGQNTGAPPSRSGQEDDTDATTRKTRKRRSA